MTASVEVFPSARPVPKPASAVGEALSAYCLAGPAAFLLLCLFVLPIGGVLVIAVTDWQFGARTMSFVGTRNFSELFSDKAFRASLANTILVVLMVVP